MTTEKGSTRREPPRNYISSPRRLAASSRHVLHPAFCIRLSALCFTFYVLLLSSCTPLGGEPIGPTAVPTPRLTPREISAGVGKAMQNSASFHFAITLRGKTVYADPGQTFSMKSIEGDVRRPDGALVTLKVSTSAALVEVRTVSLAGKQYITNPLNRQWSCAKPGDVFDPLTLFDPQRGVQQQLQQGFENATLVGSEELDGKPNYHLRGTVAGAPLMAISSNSLGVGTVGVDLWADQTTLRASKIVLVDTGTDAANPSTWTMTFSDYEKAVDVRAPTSC